MCIYIFTTWLTFNPPPPPPLTAWRIRERNGASPVSKSEANGEKISIFYEGDNTPVPECSRFIAREWNRGGGDAISGVTSFYGFRQEISFLHCNPYRALLPRYCWQVCQPDLPNIRIFLLRRHPDRERRIIAIELTNAAPTTSDFPKRSRKWKKGNYERIRWNVRYIFRWPTERSLARIERRLNYFMVCSTRNVSHGNRNNDYQQDQLTWRVSWSITGTCFFSPFSLSPPQ